MVTITNGATVLTVTKGAYNTMYAPQGWEKVTEETTGPENRDFTTVSKDEELSQSEIESVSEDKISSEDDEETEEQESEPEIELSEIPLSEMSVPQLKAYAKQLGLEVTTDSARQLRNQIRKIQEG